MNDLHHFGGAWECVDAWPFWVQMRLEGHSRFWPFEIEDFMDFDAKRMQGYWRSYTHDLAYAERGTEEGCTD